MLVRRPQLYATARTSYADEFWTEIEHCGLDDLGKPDLAHVGALNQTELDQIIAKREAEAKQRWRIADATNSVSARWQPLASTDSRHNSRVVG